MAFNFNPKYFEIFKLACEDKWAFAQSHKASGDGPGRQTPREANLVRGIVADAEGDRERSLQCFKGSIDEHGGDPFVSGLIGRYIARFLDYEIGINIILEQCLKKGEFLPDDPFFETALIMAGGGRELATMKNEVARKGDFNQEDEFILANQHENINRRLGYAFLNTMPKSGSMYLSHHLALIYKARFFRIASSGFPESHLIEEKVRILSEGGLWDQENLDASEENLDILAANGVTKILVHVRDPRQAMLSWVHHVERGMSGPDAHLRLRSRIRVPRDYDDRTMDDKLQWHAKNWLPVLVDWTKRWVDVQSSDPRFTIELSEFRNLKEKPLETINKMLEFFEILVSFSEATQAVPGLGHFRKGSLNEWRDIFSARQKEVMSRLIPKELKTMFDWVN